MANRSAFFELNIELQRLTSINYDFVIPVRCKRTARHLNGYRKSSVRKVLHFVVPVCRTKGARVDSKGFMPYAYGGFRDYRLVGATNNAHEGSERLLSSYRCGYAQGHKNNEDGG